MKKIVLWTITGLGGWIGWWAGDKIGFLTAFLLSLVGTGAGMYVGRRYFEF